MFDRCFVLVILSATTDVNKLSITPSEDNIKEKKIISGISFSVGIYIENSGIPVGMAQLVLGLLSKNLQAMNQQLMQLQVLGDTRQFFLEKITISNPINPIAKESILK